MRKYQAYAKRVPLFNGLEADEISEILHLGSKLKYKAGDSIFFQGQLGANIFIVFHGIVNITIDNSVIAKCRVGDCFGEMSALNHTPHTASAEAATDCSVFALHEKDINKILKTHAAVRFLMNIIHVLSGHLETANHVNSKYFKQIKSLQRARSDTAPTT